MTPQALHANWTAAWQALGVAAPDDALRFELQRRYGEPQRHYHTMQHLGECLAWFDREQALAERPGEVALALWFHDAIYDVHAHDNEARSADWARQALQAAGAVPEGEGLKHKGLLALIELQNGLDAPPTYVAGTRNFYVITRYNWSSYYAMSVLDLGQEVKAAMEQ